MRFARPLFASSMAIVTALPAPAQFVLQDHVGASGPGDILGIDDAELTPDGTLCVARDNTITTSARIYDMASGIELAVVFPSLPGGTSGFAQDAVVCSDERAFVSGSRLMVLDLTQLSNPLLADYDVGLWPRDLALTPDGSLCIVRGGESFAGMVGGQYVFDAATGAELAFAPGEPAPYAPTAFDVDSVVADDEHAVCTSRVISPQGDMTRVTIWDLHPAGGGVPAVVYETTAGSDQRGIPHDLAMTPDGEYCAVRSELGVALYHLDGALSTQFWSKRLFGEPGPFGGSAMDSIEVSNDYVATISRWSNGGVGAQLDLFDLSGKRNYDRVDGDPHDLAITPDGTRLMVRTHLLVLLYDLTSVPPFSNGILPMHQEFQPSSNTSYGAGLDSVALTNTTAVTLARTGNTTNIRQWDLRPDGFQLAQAYTMPDKPTDLQITPEGTRAVVSGLGHAMVIDLRARQVVLSHSPTTGTIFPWCDGVVADDAHMAAFGYVSGNFAGWLSVIDLFARPTNYCSANPNSTGLPASIFATGTASIGADDFDLWAQSVPVGQPGIFLYGTGTAATPLGDGVMCVGGSVFHFAPILGAGDVAHQPVDFTSLSGPGAILPGSTWNFQYLHRDTIGTGVNLSDALTVDFGI